MLSKLYGSIWAKNSIQHHQPNKPNHSNQHDQHQLDQPPTNISTPANPTHPNQQTKLTKTVPYGAILTCNWKEGFQSTYFSSNRPS